MDSSAPINPYIPDNPALAAFAGRAAAFAHLHRQLTSPTRTEAVLFLGQRQVGKTALLRHFDTFFDETFIGVYIPLRQTAPEDEDDWVMALARALAKSLAVRDFTLTRLTEPQDEETLRDWFAGAYLNEVLGILRYRRLALLLDDADVLIEAIKDERLPDDHLAYLQSLLTRHPQLGMALTLGTDHEPTALQPLAGEAFRLANLTPEDGRALLQKPLAGVFDVPQERADALYRATGGQPLLLQRVGRQMFEQITTQPLPPTPSPYTERRGKDAPFSDVKVIIGKVYAESEPEFRRAWQQTTRDERLVLTAIVSALYDDPLSAIDTARIESWLVETDYPLDTTAINAALRGLEYAEIARSTPKGLTITTGMMQTWLMEHARLGETVIDEPPSFAPDWRLMVVGVVVLVIVILLAISLSGGGSSSVSGTPLPTVTLAGGG